MVDEGPIHMLNIDTLLVIFNYLSLYEKLMVMRVSKTWHKIIRNHAWTVIDFRDKGPKRTLKASDRLYNRFVSNNGPDVFEYREFPLKWQFPRYREPVLKFMTLYAGINLKEIYLDVVNDEIMSYLRVNCPNIHTLGLLDEDYQRLSRTRLTKQEYHKDYENLHRLDFRCNCVDKNSCVHVISWLENCPHLRTITITVQYLHLDLIEKLSEMKCLRELHINKYDLSWKPSIADLNLSSTIGSLTSLTCFKLNNQLHSCDYRDRDHIKIDDLLQSIAHWTHLKVLALKNVRFTDESFEMMIPGILNLETLELSGISVSSSMVNLIGIYLKKLKTLELIQNKSSTMSSSCISSLQSLSHHPMLENLVVRVSDRDALRTLYELLTTLPRIKNVKILLDDISQFFSPTAYPVIKSEIEVLDYRSFGFSSVVAKEKTNTRSLSNFVPWPAFHH
ncbi:uncharacterized protein [Amphiura filiformis]|uniref:uncharacterized protein n=1 Tax=Amphiura filiformis TaxID=82378 RepID=UPI003B20D343